MQWFRNDDKIVSQFRTILIVWKNKKLISYCFLKCQVAEFNPVNWLEKKREIKEKGRERKKMKRIRK